MKQVGLRKYKEPWQNVYFSSQEIIQNECSNEQREMRGFENIIQKAKQNISYLYFQIKKIEKDQHNEETTMSKHAAKKNIKITLLKYNGRNRCDLQN